MQKRPKKINQKLKKNIEKLQAEIFNDQDNIMQDIKVSFNDVMQ
jgi:DNA-binding ferritin-like protein (Dps family)